MRSTIAALILTVWALAPAPPQYLRAADGAAPAPHAAAALDLSQAGSQIVAARQRWAASGLSAAAQARLNTISFAFADLPGAELAETRGTTITIDPTAAGWGWYVDATPGDDTEFAKGRAAGAAAGKIDLLTVLVHELGHVIGLADAGGVMSGTLRRGVRVMPIGDFDVAAPMVDEVLPAFTLPAGRSVTVTLDATINKPFPTATPNVSMQASIAATGLATKLSDDPSTGTLNDPTATPVSCPAVTVSPVGIMTATQGLPYSQVFSQSGGPGAITFSLTGALPTGMSFTASTATLSGTPTSGAGSFPISVTATSENGCSTSTRNYTLQVCTYSLTPASASVPFGGASGTVQMTTQAGCGWISGSSASWLTITGNGSGSGNVSIPYTAAANPLGTMRSATIMAAGQTFTVNQAAAPCDVTLPANASVGAAGGARTAAVSIPPGCDWTANSSQPWLTITGGSGTGDGSVAYTVAAHSGRVSRSATITVGSQTLTVRQGPGLMARSDFNLDDKADILWQHDTAGYQAIWTMNGVNLLSSDLLVPYLIDPQWKMVGSGDLNGDTKPDIVWQHQGTNVLAAWLMNGTTIQSSVSLDVPLVSDTNWRVVGVADVNADDKPDLLWQEATTRTHGGVIAWLMNGQSYTTNVDVTTSRVADPLWMVVGNGDVNNDGKSDLLWQHRGTGHLAAWLLNNSAMIESQLLPLYVADTNWWVVGTGDFNADGYTDLVWHEQTRGWVSAWLLTNLNLTTSTDLGPGRVSDTHWRIRAPR